MSVPFITIVMPVRNEARFISGTIRQVLDQEYPEDRFEILVADGMSDDGTQEIVRDLAERYPQVRLADNPRRFSSAGRNVGFRSGRGDIFLVIDGHCHLPGRQLLMSVAECFTESGAACLGRPQPFDPPGLSLFQQAVAFGRCSRLGHNPGSLIYGSYEGYASPVSNGAAYRREVFATVGYVDEAFDACEDVDFNYRIEKAGFQGYTSPRLTVRYYPRDSLGGLFRQMHRYGAGRKKLFRKHPELFSITQAVPAGFVIGLGVLAFTITGAVAGLLPVFSAQVVAGIYCIYLLMVLAVAAVISLRHGPAFLILVPVVIFVVHIGLGAGFLREMLNGTSRAAREGAFSDEADRAA